MLYLSRSFCLIAQNGLNYQPFLYCFCVFLYISDTCIYYSFTFSIRNSVADWNKRIAQSERKQEGETHRSFDIHRRLKHRRPLGANLRHLARPLARYKKFSSRIMGKRPFLGQILAKMLKRGLYTSFPVVSPGKRLAEVRLRNTFCRCRP